MPCPHNEITIVQRSQRQSAVAAAAYQSGEKLFCEYDQQVKADMFSKRTIKKQEVVTSVDTASEALAVSLSEKAGVDLAYMSQLADKSEEEIIPAE